MSDLAPLDTAIATLEETIASQTAALNQLKGERAAQEERRQAEQTDDAQEFPPGELIEAPDAARRWGVPADTIRTWCRLHGIGVKRAGRWLVVSSKLRAHLGY